MIRYTAGHTQPSDSPLPNAGLAWLFFDEQLRLVGSSSYYDVDFDASYHIGPYGGWDAYVVTPQLKVPKNGYAFLYLYNQDPNITVYFDDLDISHERGRILEENTYYPDGLKIAGLSAKAFGKLPNEFGYQGDYSEEEEETGYDEFALRMYDPTIGRWLSSDPYDEFASPYIGMGNDPVNLTDPDGGATGGWLRSTVEWVGSLLNHTPQTVGQFTGTATGTSVSAGSSGSSGGSSAGGSLSNGMLNAAAGALGQYIANKLFPLPQGPDARNLHSMVTNEQRTLISSYKIASNFVEDEDDDFDDPETTIEKIVRLTRSKIDSHEWDFDKAKDNFPKNSDKCNKFVYDVLSEAGAGPGTPNGIRNKYPPTAEQWADPDYFIPHWRLLKPDENPEPGDVVAEKINYANGATGHVGIVIGGDQTVSQWSEPREIVGQNNFGFRTVFDPKISHGYRVDAVFRRFTNPQTIKIQPSYIDNARQKPPVIKPIKNKF